MAHPGRVDMGSYVAIFMVMAAASFLATNLWYYGWFGMIVKYVVLFGVGYGLSSLSRIRYPQWSCVGGYLLFILLWVYGNGWYSTPFIVAETAGLLPAFLGGVVGVSFRRGDRPPPPATTTEQP